MPAVGNSTETDTALSLSQILIRPIDSPLIANYAINGSVSDWTAVTGATLSAVNGRLRVEITSGQSGARQEIPAVIGQRYRITGNSYAGTTSSREFRIGSSIGGAGYANAVDGDLDATFIATSSTIHVYCRVNAAGYAEFDNIYLRQELTEFDTALSLTGVIIKGTGISSATDTSLPLIYVLAVPIGLTTETDTSLVLGIAQRPGRSAETNAGFSLSGLLVEDTGVSTEIDTATSFVPLLIKPIGLALETDTASGSSVLVGSGVQISYEVSKALDLELFDPPLKFSEFTLGRRIPAKRARPFDARTTAN